MKKRSSVYTYILLIIGIIILVNMLSDRFFVRLDFTADKRYTLSKATRNILKSLDKPVTIKAYFTKELPPNVASVRRDFKEMLMEYATVSHGLVNYTFIDPNQNQETEQEALQAGIQPLIIDNREKDQVVQKKAYLGALVEYNEKSDVIPIIQPGAPMEYALSTSIKKLHTTNKPSIALIQGHKEASPAAIAQADQSMSVLYTTTPVTMNDTSDVLDQYSTAVMVAPWDTISGIQLQQLDNFLNKGGNLVLCFDRVNGNLQSGMPMGTAHNTGIEKWLKKKGVDVQEDFVIDMNCNHIGVRQQGLPFTISMEFPYFPNITTFAKHPLVHGLEEVAMPFASSIRYTGDSSHIWTPLAMTSQKSGKQSVPVYFDINHQWQESDFPDKNLVVGGLLQKRGVKDKKGELVIFSSGKFAVNGEGENTIQLSPDNINLLVNAVDYMADQTGLMDLRTKGVTARPLKQLSDTHRNFLKLFNFLFPIVLIIGYGFIRIEKNRTIRIKRKEGYV